MYSYRPPRVALFGGSFNPPHKAHMELAKYAIKELKLDLLIFIPTFQSVDKLNLHYLKGTDRVNLISLIKPKYLTVISPFELNLQKPIQSIETVKHFKKLFSNSELYFLFGDDHLPTLYTWSSLDELFSLARPIVFRRSFPPAQLPKNLDAQIVKKLFFLNNKCFPHSSSSCRSNPASHFVHKKIKKYCVSNNINLNLTSRKI